MTNQEMLVALKGSRASRVSLFEILMEKIISGSTLADNEISIFEALKNELVVQSVIVNLEANLAGSSGVSDDGGV